MISQMIVKSNIFDKINDHMSIDMARVVDFLLIELFFSRLSSSEVHF